MSDVRRFCRSGDSTSSFWIFVGSFFLRLWKIIVQWVAVVQSIMNDRTGDKN